LGFISLPHFQNTVGPMKAAAADLLSFAAGLVERLSAFG
jgi:hypothetical protein